MAFLASAMISSPMVTTAPTGTSPESAASRARPNARRMGGGSGKPMGCAASLASRAWRTLLLRVVGDRLRVVAGRIYADRRRGNRDVGRLRSDADRAGLDVERRGLATARRNAVLGHGDVRNLCAPRLGDVEHSSSDRSDQDDHGKDKDENDGAHAGC